MKKYYIMGVIIIISMLIISLILFPREIYDKFLWKYFIGPVLADALGHQVSYHGIVAKEGYSIISEVTYGIGLIAAIYGLYTFFEKFGIVVDKKFFISSLPFILLGSFGRVLEDSGLFKQPFSYFFISPLIYVQIGIYFFFSIFFGVFLKKEKYFVITIATINIIYSSIFTLYGKYFNYAIHPIIFLLISLFSILIYFLHEEKNYNASLISFGLVFFVPAFLIFLSLPFRININFHPIIFISIIISLIFILLLYIFISFFHNFMNSSIIFSHSLDAFTTWITIANPFNPNISYGEKHPIPSILLEKFNGILYPVLKILIVILILYSINDLKKNFKNTIKWLILFLGLAPGLRDFLRIFIGM